MVIIVLYIILPIIFYIKDYETFIKKLENIFKKKIQEKDEKNNEIIDTDKNNNNNMITNVDNNIKNKTIIPKIKMKKKKRKQK